MFMPFRPRFAQELEGQPNCKAKFPSKRAYTVREIFDLALAGNGISKICKHINKQHVLCPAAYAAEQGVAGYERYFEDNEENRYIWSENSVSGILRSPIYAGNLAVYKRIAANMRSYIPKIDVVEYKGVNLVYLKCAAGDAGPYQAPVDVYSKKESGKDQNRTMKYWMIVKELNRELEGQGYITMAGRTPRAFWAKKMYGYELSIS